MDISSKRHEIMICLLREQFSLLSTQGAVVGKGDVSEHVWNIFAYFDHTLPIIICRFLFVFHQKLSLLLVWLYKHELKGTS